MENKDNIKFVNKLYLDPIESINSNKLKPKGYRLKGDSSKDNEKINVMKSVPNLRINTNTSQQLPSLQSQRSQNQLLGSVIVQNWETAKNIPKDIGEFIHFPVLIDRNKYRYKDVDDENNENIFSLPSDIQSHYSRNAIMKRGEKLLKPIKPLEHISINSLNYVTSQSTALPQLTSQETEESDIKPVLSKLNAIKLKTMDSNEKKSLALTEQNANIITVKEKKPKYIDFTTFNKYLYLRDNDFLYAKRMGGPVDFVLCSYQDINPKSKITNNLSQNIGGRKILPSIKGKM